MANTNFFINDTDVDALYIPKYAIYTNTESQLFAWGYNNYGQLGTGNQTSYSSPVQIGSLTNWKLVSGGHYHTIATKTDGTLWAWGRNLYGGLGTGNQTSYSSPVQIGSLTDWNQISASYDYTIATKTDGTLWAWGDNQNGLLGLGNTATSYSSPTQIGTLTDWNQISAGAYHTIATKTDGTLWAWGHNFYQQLGLGGLGDITNRSSPVQVGTLTDWNLIACGRWNTISITIQHLIP